MRDGARRKWVCGFWEGYKNNGRRYYRIGMIEIYVV